jgi:hypothetical protein
LAFVLADMTYNSNVPRPVGVFQALKRKSYEQKVQEEIEYYSKQPGAYDLDALLKGSTFWEIN